MTGSNNAAACGCWSVERSRKMSPLSKDDRRALLELARRAVVEAVRYGRLPLLPGFSGALAQASGAFVTIHHHHRLRGCVGQVAAAHSLGETVAQCALSAALHDPRFRPVSAEEIEGLEIEISVLSDLEPVAPQDVVVGRHGLLVSREGWRGLLLPQVAIEHGWTRERFLEETCLKAGLEPEAWRDPATRIEAFTAEVFSEADLRVSRPAPANSR